VSRAHRPRIPPGVLLTAAVVVVLIPVLTPRSWLPEDKTTGDLVLAGVMIVALAAVVGGWYLFGRKDEDASGDE